MYGTAGSEFNCALDAGGGVWCWGQNNQGQLGDGTSTDRPAPVRVSGLASASAVDSGSSHACARVTDGTPPGTLWCWGSNSNSELGRGSPSPTFATVPYLAEVLRCDQNDGICGINEDLTTSPGDCRHTSCGDGKCSPWENQMNCSADCDDSSTTMCLGEACDFCGDGICGSLEKLFCPTCCPGDCAPVIGDCVCDPYVETTSNSPADCDPARTCQPHFQCNDGRCDTAAGETCASCGGSGGNDDCGACCVPTCAGKACGGDGCGGSCGSCEADELCDATFHCVSCAGFSCGAIPYIAHDTSNADPNNPNTVKYQVSLTADITYTISTCGSTASSTYLRLHLDGAEVASDRSACSGQSRIVYTPTSTGTYQLSLGCFGGGACYGTATITPGTTCACGAPQASCAAACGDLGQPVCGLQDGCSGALDCGTCDLTDPEPGNSSPSGAATATNGQVYSPTLGSPSDYLDYWKWTLPAGRTVTVQLRPPADRDYDVAIYAGSSCGSSKVRGETVGAGVTEAISWTNSGSTQTVCAQVRGRPFGSWSLDPYYLKVSW